MASPMVGVETTDKTTLTKGYFFRSSPVYFMMLLLAGRRLLEERRGTLEKEPRSFVVFLTSAT